MGRRPRQKSRSCSVGADRPDRAASEGAAALRVARRMGKAKYYPRSAGVSESPCPSELGEGRLECRILIEVMDARLELGQRQIAADVAFLEQIGQLAAEDGLADLAGRIAPSQ